MDAAALVELFEPFAAVSVRRMFGGFGVRAEGLFFAVARGGEVYLKVDDETQPAFAAAGSSPFVVARKGRGPIALSYWRLPEAAFDDPDVLRAWAARAVAAARRAEAGKRGKSRKTPVGGGKRRSVPKNA